MATFIAINCKHQSGGAMRGTLDYVSQEKKTRWGDAKLVTGHNCVPQSAYTEMLTTKQRFGKKDGRQFYHFVQSFAEDDPTTPTEANAIGLELTQSRPGYDGLLRKEILWRASRRLIHESIKLPSAMVTVLTVERSAGPRP